MLYYAVCLDEIHGTLHVVRLHRRMGWFRPVTRPMSTIAAHAAWNEMRRGAGAGRGR